MSMSLRIALTAALVSSSLALAQTAQPLPAIQLERFHLNEGSRRGLTTATGDLLPRFGFRPSVALHYENNPLVYLRGDQRVGAVVSDRLTVHLAAVFGLTSWLQVHAEVPVIAWQRGDDLTDAARITPPTATGVGSPRLGARLGILSQHEGGLASNTGVDLAFQLATVLPFGTPGTLGTERGFTLLPQLSIGRDLGPVRLGGEVHVVVRAAPTLLSPGSATGDELGQQLGLRAALTTLGTGPRFEAAIHSGIALGAAGTPPGFELLAGARVPTGPVELIAIAGPGFGNLPGTPTFRALLGVAWRTDEVCSGPHTPAQCPAFDDDTDEIRNAADRCPLEPEDFDAFNDDDGCPDPDNDSDGVSDRDDACPIEAGPALSRGCPVSDTDGDGLDDGVDACPKEAGPKARTGCPTIDTDGDGLEDTADACPKEAGTKARRGCPVRDRDGDGVEDALDNCPTVAGTADNQGCPEEERQLVVITTEKLLIKEKVFFATGKATILSKSFQLLNQVASVIREHPELSHITIEGHTDNVGSDELNRRLSQSRATSVKAYLIHQGVEEDRLRAVGIGPDRPEDTNSTEAGRANNRRVEFIIDGQRD